MNKKAIAHRVSEIVESASRLDQKTRLSAWNEICGKLVDSKAELSIASVVRQMINNGYKLSKTTVYNKGNSYQEIFNLWSDFNRTQSPKIKKPKTDTSGDISELLGIDVSTITNSVTRYQVSLMIGQLKGYKQQLDLVTQVKPLLEFPSSQQSVLPSMIKDENVALNDENISNYEVEILTEFLKNKLFTFDEDGKLYAASSIRQNTSLSSEGFKEAIERVIKNKK